MEVVLPVVAGLVVLATFAPALPYLHRLPLFGESHVETVVSFEGSGLTWDGLRDGKTVLRVAFVNHGPHRVRDTLINVVISGAVEIEAADPRGNVVARGFLGPPTDLDGQPANFWIEKDVALPVGDTMLHYRLYVPNLGELTEYITLRVAYSSDDLYGKADRVSLVRESVVDLSSRGERRGAVGGQPTGELGEDRQVGIQPNPVDPTDAEGE